MVFSSPLFLFLFLPVVLSVYFLLPGLRLRNFWLLLVSLVFYAWGEVAFVLLLLSSTGMNYFLGLWLDRQADPRRRKTAVAVAVAGNIGLLAFFKYANLAVSTWNSLLPALGLPLLHTTHIPLPIGISFFTFHALSYIIDVYRRKWRATRDPKDLALYIFFFPQLIAGPILRWNAIAPQLERREMSWEKRADGVRRFVGGLAKKVLIANLVALPADQIFALPASQLSTPVAWFGILCYTLQIYFDFSGYSDMAVGLGKMFGFEFLENFRFPYTAQSVRDFWRRWHISLSSWFRDYLYIPLGGNRVSEPRNQLNLVIVFFLCGLWHGASWMFVGWGLYHGLFLVLERTRLGDWQQHLPRPLRHGYTLLVVMLGWVLFRAETLSELKVFITGLSGLAHPESPQSLAMYATHQVVAAIAFGIPFCAPLWSWLRSLCARLVEGRAWLQPLAGVIELVIVMYVLLLAAVWLAGSTYNPFIYYRF